MKAGGAFLSNYADRNRQVNHSKCQLTLVWCERRRDAGATVPRPLALMCISSKKQNKTWRFFQKKTSWYACTPFSPLTGGFVLFIGPGICHNGTRQITSSLGTEVVIVSNWPLTSCQLIFDEACINKGQLDIHLDRSARSYSSTLTLPLGLFPLHFCILPPTLWLSTTGATLPFWLSGSNAHF